VAPARRVKAQHNRFQGFFSAANYRLTPVEEHHKLAAMKLISYLLAAPWIALTITACATPDLGDIFSGDTASDAIGLPRAEPGEIVIDRGETTVPTPYGGSGAPTTCPAVAQDIARLTALLGPDAEPPREVEIEETENGRVERAREFASDLGERAPGAAEDVARSTIVGLNPARPVVRFLGGAGEIESAARLERELALKRRAWLRGAFDVQACDHAVLMEALDAYNLLADRPEG